MVGGVGGLGVVAIFAISLALGIDPRSLLDLANDTMIASQPRELTPAELAAGDFAARVLAKIEDVWSQEFPQRVGEARGGQTRPVLRQGIVAMRRRVGGDKAVLLPGGPARLSRHRVLLDPRARSLAPKAIFAAAYVIAHEIGHQVQNQLGILGEISALQQQSRQSDGNALQVMVELMADCLAGVWARGVDGLLKCGNIEEAINAAQRTGHE